MKDTARVLRRMFDAIEFRGAGQEMVETSHSTPASRYTTG